HAQSFAQAQSRLNEMGVPADEAFWNAVRGNLAKLSDVKLWWSIVHGNIAPAIVDAELAAKAAELLPPEPWTHETWRAWTKEISAATGHKGKALYMPIRLALTGLEHGPELQDLLPMIGRKRAHARLMGQAA